MIILFSENRDLSTTFVYNWLHFFYGKKVIKVNDGHKSNFINATIDEFQIQIGEDIIESRDIESIWFRRSILELLVNKVESELVFGNKINNFLEVLSRYLTEYLNFLLQRKKTVGGYFSQDISKIYVLHKAKLIGLKTPDTLITTEKKQLLSFKQKHGKIITKPIAAMLSFFNENLSATAFTNEIEAENINKMNETFKVSLFQELIVKKYELRIFYLKGKFSSMAIFSQASEQTKIDFRNYDYKKPNRTVPYNLPKSIADKLEILMTQLKLDTGSIDMIVSETNEFYFLEVNPVGQYGMVSFPCNYHLDKEIALHLI